MTGCKIPVKTLRKYIDSFMVDVPASHLSFFLLGGVNMYQYIFPIASMYLIFTYIYHKHQTNVVGKYTSPMDGFRNTTKQCSDFLIPPWLKNSGNLQTLHHLSGLALRVLKNNNYVPTVDGQNHAKNQVCVFFFVNISMDLKWPNSFCCFFQLVISLKSIIAIPTN